MKELLEKVINGEVESVDLPFTPINDVYEVLKEIGFDIDQERDFDTNGWEVDFWVTFGEYQLSGSLFYGDMTFSKI